MLRSRYEIPGRFSRSVTMIRATSRPRSTFTIVSLRLAFALCVAFALSLVVLSAGGGLEGLARRRFEPDPVEPATHGHV